jgi:hypothetical protein
LPTDAAGFQQLKVIDDSLLAMAHPWRDSYAGHAVDSASGRVTLWRKPSRGFDQALQAIPQADRITVVCAPHSRAELERVVHDLLGTDMAGLAGSQPYSAWARHDGTCAQVESTSIEPVRRDLTQRFPAAALCFVQVG